MAEENVIIIKECQQKHCFFCKYPQGSQKCLFGTPKNALLDLQWLIVLTEKENITIIKECWQKLCFCCEYPQGPQKCLFGTLKNSILKIFRALCKRPYSLASKSPLIFSVAKENVVIIKESCQKHCFCYKYQQGSQKCLFGTPKNALLDLQWLNFFQLWKKMLSLSKNADRNFVSVANIHKDPKNAFLEPPKKCSFENL